MHPRERPTTRRQFLIRAGTVIGTISGADAFLTACGGAAQNAAVKTETNGAFIGPGGIPLARRDHPVTLPIYSDNEPIASGLNVEKGPLNLFNWDAYINPATVKKFEREFNVQVNVTTFENEEEALAKLTAGKTQFDAWWATVDYLSRSVAGKLIQPLNHSYLPHLKNVWPSLQSPFYDVHSRYSVPYTIYTTGIAWRKDKIGKGPDKYANPYDIFWDAKSYSGKVAILDDEREALAMALLRRKHLDLNTESAQLVGQAQKDLTQLTSLVNVKANTSDYTDLPTGRTWLTQAWSGDMAGAPAYMPKGTPISVVGYWRPQQNAVVGSDMITVLKGAKNPVLAHAFLNFLLDDKVGVENFSWLGYIPPLNVINPEKLVAQGYIPKNLTSTIVRQSDFDHGLSLLPLTTNGQTIWQDAWSTFKAG